MSPISSFLKYKLNALTFKVRAILYYHFFKTLSVQISKGFVLKGGGGKNKFGRNLRIFNNVAFEIYDINAELIIGNNCFLSYGAIIVCTKKITLGNDVWIGEYTSIRDASHNFDKHIPLSKCTDTHKEISIGNNVWIGRGCIILPGVSIGDNVIIGANSVVNKSVPQNSVYAGVPIKHLKNL